MTLAPRIAFVATIAVTLPAFAAGPTPAQQQALLQASVRAGASIAAGEALCNHRDIAGPRAAMRARAGSRGLSGADFDRLFDRQFAETTQGLRSATPAQRDQACTQLRELAARAKADAARKPAR